MTDHTEPDDFDTLLAQLSDDDEINNSDAFVIKQDTTSDPVNPVSSSSVDAFHTKSTTINATAASNLRINAEQNHVPNTDNENAVFLNDIADTEIQPINNIQSNNNVLNDITNTQSDVKPASQFQLNLDFSVANDVAPTQSTQQSITATQIYRPLFAVPTTPLHRTQPTTTNDTIPTLERDTPVRQLQTPVRSDSRMSDTASVASVTSTFTNRTVNIRTIGDLNAVQRRDIRHLHITTEQLNKSQAELPDTVLLQLIDMYEQLHQSNAIPLSQQIQQQRNNTDHIEIQLYFSQSMFATSKVVLGQTLCEYRLLCYRMSQVLINVLLDTVDILNTVTNDYQHIILLLQQTRIWCHIVIDPAIMHHAVGTINKPPPIEKIQVGSAWIQCDMKVVKIDTTEPAVIHQALIVQNTDAKSMKSKGMYNNAEYNTEHIIQLNEQMIECVILTDTAQIPRKYKIMLSGAQCQQYKLGDYITVIGSISVGFPMWNNLYWENYVIRPGKIMALPYVIAPNTIRKFDDIIDTQTYNGMHTVLDSIRKSEHVTKYVYQPVYADTNYLSDYIITCNLLDLFLMDIAPMQMYRRLKLQLLLTLTCSQTETITQDKELNDTDIAKYKRNTDMSKQSHDRLTLLVYSGDLITKALITAASTYHTRSMSVYTLDQIETQSKQYVTLFTTVPISDKDIIPIQNCIDSNINATHDIYDTDKSGKKRKLNKSTNGVSLIYNTVLQERKGKRGVSTAPLSTTEYDASCLFDMCSIIGSVHIDSSYQRLEIAPFKATTCNYDLTQQEYVKINNGEIPIGQTNNSFQTLHTRVMSDSERFKQYLQCCRAITDITFADAAAEVISRYYIACRNKQRKDWNETNGVRYELGTFHALIRIARSHCRLLLRKQIQLIDILIGILLIEESMACRGWSALGFKTDNLPTNDMLYIDERYKPNKDHTRLHKFNEFVRAVDTFIDRYADMQILTTVANNNHNDNDDTMSQFDPNTVDNDAD